MNLFLSVEMQDAFLGALMNVCRVDGEVTAEELQALRRIGAQLRAGADLDEEWLLLHDVSPEAFGEAVERASRGGPHRGGFDPDAVCEALVRAGIEVAAADGFIADQEILTIREFAKKTGVAVERIDKLVLDLAPSLAARLS